MALQPQRDLELGIVPAPVRARAINVAAIGTAAQAGYNLGKYAFSKMRGIKRKSATSVAKDVVRGAKKAKVVAKKVRAMSKRQKPLSKLERRLRAVEKCCASSKSTYIHRSASISQITGGRNVVEIGSYDGMGLTSQNTVMETVKYWNEETSGYDTVNVKNLTRSVDFYLKNYALFEGRNNSTTPIQIDLYVVEPKSDSSVSAGTLYANGIADCGNPSDTAINVYPSDSPQIQKYRKVVKSKHVVLQPGETIKLSHGTTGIYNPSSIDDQSSTYTRSRGNFEFLYRCSGVIGHQLTVGNTAKIGYTPFALDLVIHRTVKVYYDGGQKFKQITVTQNFNTDADPGVSLRPIQSLTDYALY